MEYVCNSTSAVAFVTVDYYSSKCHLNEIVYNSFDFHLFTIISFIFIYIIFTFLLFYIYVIIKYYLLTKRLLTPEGNALIAIHPEGYWQALVQAGNPFANLFGRR